MTRDRCPLTGNVFTVRRVMLLLWLAVLGGMS